MRLDAVRPEMLFGVIVFVLVMFVGVTTLAVRERRRKAATAKKLDTRHPAGAPLPPFKQSRLVTFVEQVGNFVSHGRASTNLWEQLIRAGYMSRAAPAVYTGVKMMLFLVGLIVTALLVLPLEIVPAKKILLFALGGAVPFFLPNMVVRMQEQKRRDEIRQFLPDAIDLLEICVTSGIGLDMAWNMVAEEIHHVSAVLGNAMDLSNFEMHLGSSRTQAMRNMATRTGAEQLSSLAAILVQSERFGTSVATALQEFANWMRDERHMRAEEAAEKLPMKLLFPMALFIFPAIMVVALGPALIHITRTLGGI
ncbi:MAG: type II secretion system F family protein [Planctomycetes bacterium]|nr:type II secretion system F family protein [Planctomycetota bacterium]